MEWQDIILAIGQWVLLIALLPSVFSNDKPAISTSILTGGVLMVFTFTFVTLSFITTAISSTIVAFVWFILAVQKYKQKKELATQTKENRTQ